MELSHGWVAAPADEDLRRAYPEPDFDDAGWEPVRVPAHWRSTAAFAESDGPLLHRTRFTAPAPADGRRSWLTFDGVFYQGDVWLDGTYVGDPEGYFFPHTYEVTDLLRDRSEHVLAVEVTCSRPRDRTAKRNITGVFQHSDYLPASWNPGGLWRPVRVHETGTVRVERLRALCTEAGSERAVLHLRAILDAAAPIPARVVTTIAGVEHVQEQTLAAGENRLAWDVFVAEPELWWPKALGEQPLHDLVVEVLVPEDPEADDGPYVASDTATRRIGLRQVRMERWVMRVNDERLFLKGSNQGPSRLDLADATAEDFDRDVRLALDTGLDLLRVHGHVSRPELYEAADRHGLLLWQDLPLQWGYARGIRKQAARQAREAVDLLGHHPSIAVWCGHNEPIAVDGPRQRSGRRWLAGQVLPTWNKSILDRSIDRALERSDSTRPVVRHSGVLPSVTRPLVDSHLYLGWYADDADALPTWAGRLPNLVRFVSELGAQAVPDSAAAFADADGRWPDLDWARLAEDHNLQKEVFDSLLPPDEFPTFEDWVLATQAYQADLLRRQVEELRRRKYRPTGGFCQHMFADAHPAITWSVLDHERHPKAGLVALAAACAPVVVTADVPADEYLPGAAIALDVHVVSDLRTPLTEATVTATLELPDGTTPAWTWSGDVPADDVVRVGMVKAVLPDVEGEMSLALDLSAGDDVVTNRYRSRITRTADGDGRMLP